MRKRTKRKVYPLTNPIAVALDGIAIVEQEKLDKLRLRELICIDDFKRGQATEHSWSFIQGLVKVAKVMAEQGIGSEALEACSRAQQSLEEDWQRYNETGRMGTTGAGLKAYIDVFEYSDLQRQCISRKEYLRYLHRSIDRTHNEMVREPQT